MELRNSLLNRRISLTLADYEKLSVGVVENLRKLSEIIKAKYILGYYPIKKEVNILQFLRELSLNKTICLPYSLKEKRDLICVKVISWDEIIKDEQGVPSPVLKEVVNEDKIEIALVPAVAFDLRGYRLGYGFGYYDNFLPKLKNALKIGVVFDFQIIDEIQDAKGAKVDLIVSESRIIRIN